MFDEIKDLFPGLAWGRRGARVGSRGYFLGGGGGGGDEGSRGAPLEPLGEYCGEEGEYCGLEGE